MKKYLLGFVLIFMLFRNVTAQQIYTIDASNASVNIRSGQLKMGDPGPLGKEIRINNRYMTIGGRPVIPVMGEMHFSRVPRALWEDVILKMKACGVNIIACYVIWIHHEEAEGQFNWTDNKDLRAFVQLCHRHGLLVYPRIGPWCHAEVRNGGTPDWLLQKIDVRERTMDTTYQHYAEEWYKQIGNQLKGLMYKDGGAVIGVQLENEYGYGKAGEPYILWLKQTALKYGINVPMYTVTGWGNGSVPRYEVIPLWGAYPDEPWATNLLRNSDCQNYRFTPFRDDDKIGNAVKKDKDSYLDNTAYPYFTCEMGVGIENTDHRRLQIGKLDGLVLVMAKLGSGSNLIGYYMFAGGSNPHGLLTSMEENKESGSWNTNPVISYDFQAAIRETGELNDSYFEIKKLHYFLNEFGDRLANMGPVFPSQPSDLQCAVRASADSAFLFGINYCRHRVKEVKTKVQFKIKLKNETICFPENAVNLPDSSMFIWPLNFRMDQILLRYATAQPLCRVNAKNLANWIFIQDIQDDPEFSFDEKNILSINTRSGQIEHKNGRYLISHLQPGSNCYIDIVSVNNIKQRVIILSRNQSQQAWLFKDGLHNKSFYLSDAGLYTKGDSLYLSGLSNRFKLESLDNPAHLSANGQLISSVKDGLFSSYDLSVSREEPKIKIKQLALLEDAAWLKTSVGKLTDDNQLNHQFFVKGFSLDNPSEIKSATLEFFSDNKPGLQLNNRWINQETFTGKINAIDITAYLKRKDNRLLFDFPVDSGNKAFAARIIVNYMNYDQTVILTDQSWLTTQQYTYPQLNGNFPGLTVAEITKHSGINPATDFGFNTYQLIMDSTISKTNLKDMLISINYTGDKGYLYNNQQLVADDFNNGKPWNISLQRISPQQNNRQFKLFLLPLLPADRKYFDVKPPAEQPGENLLKNIQLVPVYQLNIKTSQ